MASREYHCELHGMATRECHWELRGMAIIDGFHGM